MKLASFTYLLPFLIGAAPIASADDVGLRGAVRNTWFHNTYTSPFNVV